MKRLVLIVGFLLAACPALAQSVQQSGSVTRNHSAIWNSNGIIQDGGSASDSPLSTFGVDGQFCVMSDRISAPARNLLCLQAATNGPATITLQNYGIASPQNLNFILNGVPLILPSGGGAFATLAGSPPYTVNELTNFNTTAGVLGDSGIAAAGGVITAGAWQGSPVAVLYGGTGSANASGARTNLGLGTMATQNASAVAITGGSATGLPTPVNPTDVAIKSYVDATATGLIILPQSALATTTVLPNSPTYSNGSSGVGATLTAGSNTTLTVDGASAPLNTVVLVKNQASAFQNGIYTVTTAGSGGAPWVLTRATYFNTAAQMKAGSYTFVTGGSTNVNSSYVLQNTIATVGTDAVTFNQFSSSQNVVVSLGGSTGIITLGNGLSIASNILTNNISAGAGISITGTNPLTIAAALATSAVTGSATTYTSGQNGVIVERSNSGSPMSDTLPGTSPGVLPANTYVTVKNIDTGGVLAINVGSGAAIKGQLASTGFVYICPGQSISFYSDGSNYFAIGQPATCNLTASTTFYAAATGGSATNNGLTPSTPLNSITAAYSLAQSAFNAQLLNPSSQTITIQGADGSYGVTTLANRIPGQGDTNAQKGIFPVIIQGNTVTPTNATISTTANSFGALQVNGDASLLVQGFSLSTSASGGSGLYVNRAWVAFKTMDFGSVSLNQIVGTHQAHLEVAGNYTWHGTMQAHWLLSDSSSLFVENSPTITATSGPTMNEFAAAQYVSSIVMDSTPIFTGSNVVSGSKYSIFLNSVLNLNGISLPGPTAGSTQTGGQVN